MKALISVFLASVCSASAMAAPMVLSKLTVCREKQNPVQPITVTWTQEGQNQNITFESAKNSETYSVIHSEVPDFGGSILTYAVPDQGTEHITIFCDAVMTNEDELLTVSNCGNDY